jgi:hypothetical protein
VTTGGSVIEAVTLGVTLGVERVIPVAVDKVTCGIAWLEDRESGPCVNSKLSGSWTDSSGLTGFAG